MTDDLKPVRCGCGGEAKVFSYDALSGEQLYYVNCTKCGICTPSKLTKAEAIEAWNRAMGKPIEIDRDKERTAKVKELDKRSETMMAWEGVCTKCGAYTMHEMNYCFHCGCKLEWEYERHD